MALVQQNLAPTFLKSTTSYACYKLNELDNYVICKFLFDGNKFSIIGSGICMKTPALAWENSNIKDSFPKYKMNIFVRKEQ